MALDAVGLENLAVFYRTLSTERLLGYRSALVDDLPDFPRSRYTAAFCRERIEVINKILVERGVVEV